MTEQATTARKRPAATKDPRGGLTAAGRAAFKKRDGSNLKPGVKGPADTPEKMRRKGSFLRRHFANPRGPMVDENGKPTRLALSAHAWGEPVPKTMSAAKQLAEKGSRLLERYAKVKLNSQRESNMASKTSAKKTTKNSLVNNINKRKKAGTSRSKRNSTVSKETYDEMKKGWSE